MDELLRDSIAEMSLVVTKASFDKSEPDPNKKRRIAMTNSDVSPDLYREEMSLELFSEFTRHIENNDPIPEPFKDALCEDAWCGGMPYLSIAHYHAGRDAKNVPGMPDSVYIDGKQLKSKAYLYDNPMGRKLFDALCADEEARKSKLDGYEPVRVSIGFLDLEHAHEVNEKSFTFTRTGLGQKCALCKDKVGGKIYKKGYLIHLAATRKPVNPRTEMGLEEKSMSEIITKQEDAASIVGEELAQELESKSLADDVLVIKSEEKVPEPVTNLETVKSEILDEVAKMLSKYQALPVVEESKMEQEVIKSQETDEKKEIKDAEKDTEKDLKGKSEVAEVNPLDAQFEALKSALASGKPQDVQAVFNAFGAEVEKSFTPAPPTANDIAAIVEAAVEKAVSPLKIQIAQISAAKSDTVSRASQHPVSRALQLKAEDLTQKSQSPQLTQIQRLARKSVGLDA
jgi:hypothetical protein